MKGIIFRLLAEVVEREYGELTWDQLLEAAGLEGAYTSLGNYADEELSKLVAAASRALKLSPDEVVRWFGRKAIPLLAEKYPAFFTPHRDTRSFLLTLNDIIHPEVRKLYPGAQVPTFGFDTASPTELGMTYRSPRRLCALGEGLILGASDYYGETVTLNHPECMKHGHDRCVWKMSFAQQESSGNVRAA